MNLLHQTNIEEYQITEQGIYTGAVFFQCLESNHNRMYESYIDFENHREKNVGPLD